MAVHGLKSVPVTLLSLCARYFVYPFFIYLNVLF